MAKVNEKEIYEIKPWLNDTPQNKDGLSELVGGGGGESNNYFIKIGQLSAKTVTGTSNTRGEAITIQELYTFAELDEAIPQSASAPMIMNLVFRFGDYVADTKGFPVSAMEEPIGFPNGQITFITGETSLGATIELAGMLLEPSTQYTVSVSEAETYDIDPVFTFAVRAVLSIS